MINLKLNAYLISIYHQRFHSLNMQDIQGPMLPRRFSMPEDTKSGMDYPSIHEELFSEEMASHHRRNNEDGVVIPYTGEPFNGIIAYLWRSCHDNPVKQSLLSISGNSFNSGYIRVLPQILDPNFKGNWNSLNEAGSYLSIDFLEHKINLTAYTLKTYNAANEWRHLRSWVVEGSNGSGWKEIHKVKRTSLLNGENKVATFSCPNTCFYQTIRFKMTGPNHYGDWYFFLAGIELFGILD